MFRTFVVYRFPEELKRRLKLAAADQRLTISEMLAQIVTEWLDNRGIE